MNVAESWDLMFSLIMVLIELTFIWVQIVGGGKERLKVFDKAVIYFIRICPPLA